MFSGKIYSGRKYKPILDIRTTNKTDSFNNDQYHHKLKRSCDLTNERIEYNFCQKNHIFGLYIQDAILEMASLKWFSTYVSRIYISFIDKG